MEAPLLSPAPGTAAPGKQCPPRPGEAGLLAEGTSRPASPRGRGVREGSALVPPSPWWPHKLPEGGVAHPPALSALRRRLPLCPRVLRGASRGGGARRPGRAAAAGSPLIVRGGGGGGGGGAPEPRQDVAEAVVAVQLGLALGALDGALEAAAEEALRAGRQEGEGEAGLARRRRWARDPRGTRAPARAAARPRAGAGSGSAPAARSPRRPPARRPSADGPARAARPSPPRAARPAQPSPAQPATSPPPLSHCCHGDAEPSRAGRGRGCPSPPGAGDRGRGGGAAGGRGPAGAWAAAVPSPLPETRSHPPPTLKNPRLPHLSRLTKCLPPHSPGYTDRGNEGSGSRCEVLQGPAGYPGHLDP